jgi:hypothetical protein
MTKATSLGDRKLRPRALNQLRGAWFWAAGGTATPIFYEPSKERLKSIVLSLFVGSGCAWRSWFWSLITLAILHH